LNAGLTGLLSIDERYDNLAAFYLMAEIAAQLSILSAAQINGIPTNVNVELGESATPEGVVEVVVRN
jgi:hypothetical protein